MTGVADTLQRLLQEQAQTTQAQTTQGPSVADTLRQALANQERAAQETAGAAGTSSPDIDARGRVVARLPPAGPDGPQPSLLQRAGPVIADIARSGESGVTRGVAGLGDLISLPRRGFDYALAAGANLLTDNNAPEWTQRPREYNRNNPPPLRALAESVPAIERRLNYEPQTTAGEYTQTVGEFLPGAAVAPGGLLGNLVRYGAAPALASEALGQISEDTAVEPYARTAGAVLTPLVTGRPTNAARPVVPRADPEDARMAQVLLDNGVRPTAGQTTQNSLLRRLEDSVGEVPGQAEDFTAAALRTTGSGATRATPETLASAQNDIVRAMDDAVSGVSFVPNIQMAQNAESVIVRYQRATANANIVPDVENIALEIIDLATSPQGHQVSLSTLQDWRSRLGALTRNNKDATREAAFELRSLIDDASEQQLQALGRSDDVARLAAARTQYRNWLTVARASTMAGAENGIISPTALQRSIVWQEGWQRAATGRTTELGGLARAGAGILRPESAVRPGGARVLPQLLGTASVGGAMGAQLSPNSPISGGLLGLAAGAGGMRAAHAAMRSSPVQSLLMDPGSALSQSLITAPGVYSSSQ